MASAEFAQREDIFYRTREAAIAILDNPLFDAPEHPYTEVLRAMVDFAVLGILDIKNGMVHPQAPPFDKSLIIAPVLKQEVPYVGPDITFSGIMCVGDIEVDSSAPDLSKVASVCDHNPELLNPVMWVPPKIASRPGLVLGSTTLHETDHAWRILNAKKLIRALEDSDEAIARLEVSAYRLEQQVCFSEIPELYDQMYGELSVTYADLDFSKRYNPKDKDKILRYAKVVAFINFVLDELGGEVDKKPGKKLIKVLKAQKLM